MLYKIFQLSLFVFLGGWFLTNATSVQAVCNNQITIYYPTGCESICLPEDGESCVECSTYEACIGDDDEPPANYDGYCYNGGGCACADGSIVAYNQYCADPDPNSCGNGLCDSSESCGDCPSDCGTCSEWPVCGDSMCTGFESCLTCQNDCGTCVLESGSWWQVRGGLVGSNTESGIAIKSKVPVQTCTPPDCDPSLMATDWSGQAETAGYVLTLGGSLKVNGGVTSGSTNIFSIGTGQSRFYEYYEFFYRLADFGLNPEDNFYSSYANAQKPNYDPNKTAYYRNGDLTINSPWSVASNESYIIFVNGDLYLSDGNGSSDHLIDVEPGGFLGFIVKNNLYVEESLGNSDLNSLTANVEGVFVVNGQINIQSRGPAAGGDDRFIGEGTFIGWQGVNLERDFDDGAGRAEENKDKPTELFVYRPDFMVNLPDLLRNSPQIWQQVQ